jgi:hypothetical protein
VRRAGAGLSGALLGSLAGSLTLPPQTFFKPRPAFAKALAKDPFLRHRRIVEIGAGQGTFAAALKRQGLDVVAIDAMQRDEQDPIVQIADAETFDYDQDDVVIVCRPCHSDWFITAFERAIECGVMTMFYIGLRRNVQQDLNAFDFVFYEHKLDVGEEGEVMLSVRGPRDQCSVYRLIQPSFWAEPHWMLWKERTRRYENELGGGFGADDSELPIIVKKEELALDALQMGRSWVDRPASAGNQGWIDPEGSYHPCGYHEHDALIRQKFGISLKRAEALGFVRLQGQFWVRAHGRLTPKQKKKLEELGYDA